MLVHVGGAEFQGSRFCSVALEAELRVEVGGGFLGYRDAEQDLFQA